MVGKSVMRLRRELQPRIGRAQPARPKVESPRSPYDHEIRPANIAMSQLITKRHLPWGRHTRMEYAISFGWLRSPATTAYPLYFALAGTGAFRFFQFVLSVVPCCAFTPHHRA